MRLVLGAPALKRWPTASTGSNGGGVLSLGRGGGGGGGFFAQNRMSGGVEGSRGAIPVSPFRSTRNPRKSRQLRPPPLSSTPGGVWIGPCKNGYNSAPMNPFLAHLLRILAFLCILHGSIYRRGAHTTLHRRSHAQQLSVLERGRPAQKPPSISRIPVPDAWEVRRDIGIISRCHPPD